MNCVRCGETYNKERAKLGYKTCLSCGDKSAIVETEKKASRVTCAYNKSGLMYVADIKTTLDYKPKR